MIGHGEPTVRRGLEPQNEMAPRLPVNLVSEAAQEPNQLRAAQDGQPRHGSSMTSSEKPGGIGSPRARRLSM